MRKKHGTPYNGRTRDRNKYSQTHVPLSKEKGKHAPRDFTKRAKEA